MADLTGRLKKMEVGPKLPMREVNRVCKDATKKALHELVYSRKFIEYESARRMKEARSRRFYKGLCFFLGFLLLLAVGRIFFFCGPSPSSTNRPFRARPSLLDKMCSRQDEYRAILKPAKFICRRRVEFLRLIEVHQEWIQRHTPRARTQRDTTPQKTRTKLFTVDLSDPHLITISMCASIVGSSVYWYGGRIVRHLVSHSTEAL